MPSIASEVCETVLRTTKAYNLEHKILNSEIEVIDRLLSRGVEMREVYEELHRKLGSDRAAIGVFFQQAVSTAAFWSPAHLAEARERRDEIGELNVQVAEAAAELADLLERRSQLENTSGFSSDTFFHICEAIDAAAAPNPLFRSYVSEPLRSLWYRFDLKYWPSIAAVVRAVGDNAGLASTEAPVATDPLTAAATAARRGSLADTFRALFAALDAVTHDKGGHLPLGFSLSDSAIAALGTCLLGLGPDAAVGASYVKRLRQRDRQSSIQRPPRT